MAATPKHGQLSPGEQGIHVPFQFSFPNATSRTGAPASRLTGGASKLALQLDDFSLWMLSSVSPTPTWVRTTTGSAANTATGQNLGTGIPVFREASAGDLRFRTLVGGHGVNVTSATSLITITASAPSATNLGTGASLYTGTFSSAMNFKSLLAGGGVDISEGDNSVTISASAKHFSFTIGASTNWNSEAIPVWQSPRGASVDLLEVDAAIMGGSAANLVFNLQKRAWNALPTAGTNLFSAGLSATASGASLTSFATSRINPRDHVVFTTGAAAESGSANYVSVTVYYGEI